MIIEQFSLNSVNDNNFIRTSYINELVARSIIYINSGYPINLCGPAGTGKTTLAFYLAKKIGRPAILLHGSDEITSAKLVGGNYGYRKKTKVDNYIHSVEETEESLYYQWVEGMLSAACRNGMTLIYDEFTRTKPEVNNLLLSILEEKILSLPGWQREKHYLKVHPEFRAILTSNPEEYAGIYQTQVALVDRMINIEMAQFDLDTEVSIISLKTGLPQEEAKYIVSLVKSFREQCRLKNNSSVRSSIKIGTIVNSAGAKASLDNSFFVAVVKDVLLSEIIGAAPKVKENARLKLQSLLTSGRWLENEEK
jgi:gas vesicle protein GvpN